MEALFGMEPSMFLQHNKYDGDERAMPIGEGHGMSRSYYGRRSLPGPIPGLYLVHTSRAVHQLYSGCPSDLYPREFE